VLGYIVGVFIRTLVFFWSTLCFFVGGVHRAINMLLTRSSFCGGLACAGAVRVDGSILFFSFGLRRSCTRARKDCPLIFRLTLCQLFQKHFDFDPL
jgi:hypothetical protein